MSLLDWFRGTRSQDESWSWRDIEKDDACRHALVWVWAAHSGTAARLSMELAAAPDSYKRKIEEEALRALRQAEPRLSKGTAIDALTTRRAPPLVRELAAWYLGEIGVRTRSQAVVQPLIDATLHDRSYEVQGRASEALRKCGEMAIDSVVDEARKGGYERRRLFYVLGEIGDQRALSVLKDLLEREPSLKAWIEDELAKVIQRIDAASGGSPA
jgi:HEAT repeat protein